MMFEPTVDPMESQPSGPSPRMAFDALLTALDPNRERAGARYETLRLKTIKLFEWWGSEHPEELTDETMDRVGRKLAEGTVIRADDVGPFLRGVARLVFLESLREREKERKKLNHRPEAEDDEEEAREKESHLSCLDRCLEALTPENRQLIVDYYSELNDSNIAGRKLIAKRLGISTTALRIRAHRLRERLQSCVRECVEAQRLSV